MWAEPECWKPDSGARGRPLVAAAGKPDRGRGREPAIPGEGDRAGPGGRGGGWPGAGRGRGRIRAVGGGEAGEALPRRPRTWTSCPPRPAGAARQPLVFPALLQPDRVFPGRASPPLQQGNRGTEGPAACPDGGPAVAGLAHQPRLSRLAQVGAQGPRGAFVEPSGEFQGGRPAEPRSHAPEACPAGRWTDTWAAGRMLPGAQVCENLSSKCKTSSGATG